MAGALREITERRKLLRTFPRKGFRYNIIQIHESIREVSGYKDYREDLNWEFVEDPKLHQAGLFICAHPEQPNYSKEGIMVRGLRTGMPELSIYFIENDLLSTLRYTFRSGLISYDTPSPAKVVLMRVFRKLRIKPL